MDTNDCQRELDAAAVRASNTDPKGTANLPVLADVSEAVLRAAEQCEGEVAAAAYFIRCQRAARGGTSGTSQTAAVHLAHHRLKSVPLDDAYRALQETIYRAEEALRAPMRETLDKLLKLEIHRANLARCEAAIEQRARDKTADRTGVLSQARRVVESLGRLGVMEGHWSTISTATIREFHALIMADNAAAGVGSPDAPRKDWKRVNGAR